MAKKQSRFGEKDWRRSDLNSKYRQMILGNFGTNRLLRNRICSFLVFFCKKSQNLLRFFALLNILYVTELPEVF